MSPNFIENNKLTSNIPKIYNLTLQFSMHTAQETDSDNQLGCISFTFKYFLGDRPFNFVG
jgi:hypothetical protein